MTEKVAAQFDDINDLFAADLDDIADLSSFETPASGAYVLKVTTSVKEINDKDAVEAAFEIIDTVELKYPDEEDKRYVAPSKPGTQFSTAFILGSSTAEGYLKKFLAPFGEHFGTTKVGELVRDKIKDVVISAIVTRRADKDDPDRFYASVKNITIAS